MAYIKNKAWRLANPDKAAAQRKRNYDKHRTKRLAYMKQYRALRKSGNLDSDAV